MRCSSLVSLVAILGSVAAAPAPLFPFKGMTVQKLQCAAGQQYGTQFNTMSYPTTFANVETVVGRFQHSDWQGLPQTSSSGIDNFPGSTRTVSFGPISLVEKIEYILTTPVAQEQIFYLDNGPIALSADLTINEYLEDLKIEILCGVKDTIINWLVQFCYTSSTDMTATVSGIFGGAHVGALANVTTQLGVGPFVGC